MKDAAAVLAQVPPNWKRPVLPKPKNDDRQQQQQDSKKIGGKATPGRAVSGVMEDELAGKTCGYIIIDTLSGQSWTGEGRNGRRATFVVTSDLSKLSWNITKPEWHFQHAKDCLLSSQPAAFTMRAPL